MGWHEPILPESSIRSKLALFSGRAGYTTVLGNLRDFLKSLKFPNKWRTASTIGHISIGISFQCHMPATYSSQIGHLSMADQGNGSAHLVRLQVAKQPGPPKLARTAHGFSKMHKTCVLMILAIPGPNYYCIFTKTVDRYPWVGMSLFAGSRAFLSSGPWKWPIFLRRHFQCRLFLARFFQNRAFLGHPGLSGPIALFLIFIFLNILVFLFLVIRENGISEIRDADNIIYNTYIHTRRPFWSPLTDR